jgi:uncharacterized RDD family membrane protein YckC
MSDAAASPASQAVAPSLSRRMASFVYEGLILFGILLIPGAVGAIIVAVTGQQHSVQGDLILQVTSFSIYAAYFTWFWSKRGQTLPMQTWHIKVVTADGQPLSWGRAFVRYLASWLWVAPAALIAVLNHWSFREDTRAMVVGASLGVLGYALLALVLPQKQFLHDLICGTKLVTEARRAP